MDISLYRSFIAIVESGNLTQAAEFLHIAQPALTRHVKLLEKEFHSPLLKTGKGQRHVEVTPAGRILYHKAKYLVSLEDQIARDISASNAGITGTLRLTTSPSVAFQLIAHSLAEFSNENLGITFELLEASTEEQAQNLLNGISEIGIANAPIVQPELFQIHLTLEDHMALYVNKKSPVLKGIRLLSGSPRAVTAPISLIYRILESLPLCTTQGCHQADMQFCAEMGISPHPLCVSTTVTAALQWAKEDRAGVMAPITAGQMIPENLIAFLLPASHVSNFRTLYTVKGAPLSELAKHFLDFILEPADQVDGEIEPVESPI